MADLRVNRVLWKCFFATVIIYIVDYLGLLIHLFELEYTRYYHLPNAIQYNNEDTSNGNSNSNDYYNFGYLKRPINKCSVPPDGGGSSPHLTILVKSARENNKRRAAIRATWGFEQRFSDVHYRCVFLLGASDSTNSPDNDSILSESLTHNDIIQGDFVDTYFNNTLKTMIGIRWAKAYCANSDFYMFVDDDYYVSVKNILKFIAYPGLYPNTITGLWSQRQEHKSLSFSRLYAGYVMQTSPLRNRFSKWYITLAEYPFDLWPPYVTAGAFVLSNDALDELYTTGKHTPAFRFDDIFLAMVALNANMTLTHCDRFHFDKLPYKGAKSYQHVLAAHGFDDSEYMEKIWTECRAAGYA